MGRKKRDKIEFRFYELPQGESVLGLMGNRWVGNYGNKDRPKELHFHNEKNKLNITRIWFP